MLMNHSDSQGIGIVGIGYGGLFFIDEYLSRIRMVQPEENVHQSALTSSVLTQEAVDFLLSHDEINPVIGAYRPKTFDDSNHSDCVHIFLLYLSGLS